MYPGSSQNIDYNSTNTQTHSLYGSCR